MGKEYFVSVEFLRILRVNFRWLMGGLSYIHNGRGEGSCKSPLRWLPAAPWDQQSRWRVQGMLEEQEPVQKPGRERVLRDFSATRGAAGVKYMSLSGGRPAGILEGYVWAGCCTPRSICTLVDPLATFQVRQDLQQVLMATVRLSPA